MKQKQTDCHWVYRTVNVTKPVLFEFLFLELLVPGHHFQFDVLIMLGWKSHSSLIFCQDLHSRLLVKQSSMFISPWN